MATQTLGELLFSERAKRDLSLRDAGKLIGMPHTSLADHENDDVRDPTISNLKLFAVGYRISLMRIVTAALQDKNGRKN